MSALWFRGINETGEEVKMSHILNLLILEVLEMNREIYEMAYKSGVSTLNGDVFKRREERLRALKQGLEKMHTELERMEEE